MELSVTSRQKLRLPTLGARMHLDLVPPSEAVYKQAARLAHDLARTHGLADLGAIIWRAVDSAKLARWCNSETWREPEQVKDNLASCAALCMIALAVIEARESKDNEQGQ